MKALKITLMLALFVVSLSSCTKQDLNEDDTLIAPTDTHATYHNNDVNER